jgi:hypothetical protein
MVKREKDDLVVTDVQRSAAGLRISMARGVLILDENVQVLKPALKELNIRVIVPKAGLSDDDIKEDLLPQRIFVTKNTTDFEDDVAAYEYGLVSLDALTFIDPQPSGKNATAKMISSALSKFDAWSRRHGFILRLKPDGKHTFEEVT